MQRLRQLETTEKAAHAKKQAAQAIKHAGGIASSGADVSVDNVTACIQTRADVADEKFKRAMGSFATGTEKDAALAEVEARLTKKLPDKHYDAARKYNECGAPGGVYCGFFCGRKTGLVAARGKKGDARRRIGNHRNH